MFVVNVINIVYFRSYSEMFESTDEESSPSVHASSNLPEFREVL